MGLREQILATRPKLVPVECPAWGCTVHVDVTLPLAERLELIRLAQTRADITIDVVILAARDEDGSRLFTPEDAEALAQQDGATLLAISLAAVKGTGALAVEATEEATEAARKN